jgi:hypothetical protein
MLRGAGYVSITSTMDAECGAISGDIGSEPSAAGEGDNSAALLTGWR